MSDWKETIFRDSPPPQKCTSISAPGTFSGPFMGSAHSHYMLAYITADTGLFYGFTFFDGTLGTRKGSFVLSDQGVFDTNAATTRWNIVAGSGINDFAGISGSGGFSATEGLKVSFELEFELPA